MCTSVEYRGYSDGLHTARVTINRKDPQDLSLEYHYQAIDGIAVTEVTTMAGDRPVETLTNVFPDVSNEETLKLMGIDIKYLYYQLEQAALSSEAA